MKKYKLTEESMIYKGHTLWRIQNTITGEMGGWIESYDNMTQQEGCMIWDEAKVYGNAYIDNEATINGEAEVFGHARISNKAKVEGSAKVYGDAIVRGNARVCDDAEVMDQAIIEGYGDVRDQAKVYDRAVVSEYSMVRKRAKVYGEANVFGFVSVIGDAEIFENAKVHGFAIILEDAKIYGHALVWEKVVILGHVEIYGNARVYGSVTIKDFVRIYGNAVVKGNDIIGGHEEFFSYDYVWEDVALISSLQVFGVNVESTASTTIYANGRQQMAVAVQLLAHDSGGYPFQLADHIVYENIQFVNYKNEQFGNQFAYSDRPGEFVVSSYQKSQEKSEDILYSQALFYLSTNTVMSETKICVCCAITVIINDAETEKEYTTALENNSSGIRPSYVSVLATPPRVYTQNDIIVETLVEKNPNDYNSLLMKYYIQFTRPSTAILKKVESKTDFWFHYKQKGNYKGFATSTDTGV